MKHETFYISIETEENGYHVTRQKHVFPKYDRACMLTMKETIDYWIAKCKPSDSITIDIIGNGTNRYFKQATIIRFVKHQFGSEYRIIWFGDNQTANDYDRYEYDSKKQAIAKYNELYRLVADYIEYDPND